MFNVVHGKINPFNIPGNLVLNANHIVHSIVLIMSRLGGLLVSRSSRAYFEMVNREREIVHEEVAEIIENPLPTIIL